MVEVDFENFVNYLRSGNTDKLNIISFQQNQQHKINLSTQLIFDRILTKTVVQLKNILQCLFDPHQMNKLVQEYISGELQVPIDAHDKKQVLDILFEQPQVNVHTNDFVHNDKQWQPKIHDKRVRE
ncbi:Hypothetical_protein [Hexamita inflata]|uniref:Hypothetical_protein n=1 Tax=Hexamita inflata TaxID=28002 RepID=A0AA86UTN5_9EUKA|nr:Hypothetical protein HINF_LOCUS37008 [Hexamita inflata]